VGNGTPRAVPPGVLGPWLPRGGGRRGRSPAQGGTRPGDLVGPADKLSAARLLTAWATGFISMELAGAFQLGGNVDAAFEYGIGRLTAALHEG